ncbi:probable protein arginine N-methyltransferase 3 [Chenopodium quinoa]|uniref:probable protein arginine N-methyltransferase 3 n=1 Tax=Chenopodium quinoa TaxID=63459 RepID=UPI000B793F58|nr:probable protein arginine N-methyltransferase 3 [Chenopodium quinoa]
MASNSEKLHNLEDSDFEIDEDGDDLEIDQGWNDWNADENDDNVDEDSEFKCLFCEFSFNSCDSLLQHCYSIHHFDFPLLKKSLGLDFYGCFKLVNYIRAMVAQNTCWSCGHQCKSNQELLNHLHGTKFSELKLLWDDDKYLQPFMEGDSLLYSFDQDEDFEDECMPPVDEEELSRIVGEAKELSRLLGDVQKVCSDDEMMLDADSSSPIDLNKKVTKVMPSISIASSSREAMVNGVERDLSDKMQKNLSLRASFGRVAASEIKKVNESYFGSYSSFGIHREMLSDKARMDSYSQAILKNPSLFGGAAVMDVGCGTGILSLFAAQAGASRVIAVDASEKMAAVATQIAKDNGFLRNESICKGNNQSSGVVEVVHGMIEDIEKSVSIEPHTIDVLLSEWMGYCLLYESMLSSVLFARDRWLKPGGAILPDTATMFAAGFGKGCTSLPFWENVYGIDMSSVGKELVKDAAEFPIVDVVNSHDIVTETATLKNFDLATMKIEDMDFTSSIELQPKLASVTELSEVKNGVTWCHGVVLWFDTGFTSRFCKEMPANLSTSPYTLKTHWSQSIFTFREPIALSSGRLDAKSSAVVGTDSCPASKIEVRISIVRAQQHRAIDISLETSAVSHDCRRQAWPVQIFNLS